MNFDVVIIGGGLAGLTCGIRLQQQGKRCVIVNNGQAAMDFSSGAFGLLGETGGTKIAKFDEKQTAYLSENHPYRVLGFAQSLAMAQQFERDFAKPLALSGSSAHNHWRVTPLGGLRPAWLSPENSPMLGWTENFAYRKLAILGIEGYHDYQAELFADNLKQQPTFAQCEIITDYLHLPELDELRQSGREFRSVHISQRLEQQIAFDALVREIRQRAQGADAIFLPACFGIDHDELFQRLQQASQATLFELPTLPPSLLGIRQRKALRQLFERAGGVMINGDKAERAEVDENGKILRIFTRLHAEHGLSATHFVLASGSFFSGGLSSEFDRICDPLFGADIQGLGEFNPQDRLSWTAHRFSATQPYQSAGVIINSHCQVRKNGEFLPNLYAAGSVIGGYNGIAENCGSGVAVVTALTVAQQIGGQ